MSLLLRLFDPDRGAIELDGVDIRRFSIASLRRSIAMALQENLLFGTTIRENMRYAVPDASDEAVREAVRVAGADEFIERLEQGLETPLGERGTKLSTGQRQRLSIARAVLKDTPILMLDEPTASLDAETELRVLQNLAAWGRGRLDPPHHAPALDDPPRRPDPRPARGAHRRGRHPRRAHGAADGALPPARRARVGRRAGAAHGGGRRRVRGRLEETGELGHGQAFRVLVRASATLAPFRARFAVEARAPRGLAAADPAAALAGQDHRRPRDPEDSGRVADAPYPAADRRPRRAPRRPDADRDRRRGCSALQLVLVILLGAVGTGGSERDQADA